MTPPWDFWFWFDDAVVGLFPFLGDEYFDFLEGDDVGLLFLY